MFEYQVSSVIILDSHAPQDGCETPNQDNTWQEAGESRGPRAQEVLSKQQFRLLFKEMNGRGSAL